MSPEPSLYCSGDLLYRKGPQTISSEEYLRHNGQGYFACFPSPYPCLTRKAVSAPPSVAAFLYFGAIRNLQTSAYYDGPVIIMA